MLYPRKGKILFLVLCIWLLLGATSQARDMVSGKYSSSAGKSIVLDLKVADPSPGNLIIHQFLPPGIDIIKSHPRVMKFDKKSGKAKWLIKKVQPGKMSISMELSKSIPAGAIRAEVRCRDQKTGEMTQITITP
ncbi:MAG: hypothetical protein KQH63_02555 [Desulfobulbaceae bacterium]|nr:hypothetical protein [Desulfobulbaceae bacterium]